MTKIDMLRLLIIIIWILFQGASCGSSGSSGHSTARYNANSGGRSLPKIPWFGRDLKVASPAEVDKEAATTISKGRIKQRLASGAKLSAIGWLQMVLASEATVLSSSTFKVDPTLTLFVTNCAVYGAWILSEESNNDKLRHFMHQHFLLRNDDIGKERLHTMLLSGFSHMDRNHLVSNMGALLLFGPKISKTLSTRIFSYFYIFAIYASSLFDQFYYSPRFQPERKVRILFWKFSIPTRSLGASGAISSLLTYYCLKHPTDLIDLSEMVGAEEEEEPITIPAVIVALVALLSDLFPIFDEKGSNIGHGAHLGGYLFGLCAYLVDYFWTRRMKKKHK
jgi:membrane associated rhomboid family serine protease